MFMNSVIQTQIWSFKTKGEHVQYTVHSTHTFHLNKIRWMYVWIDTMQFYSEEAINVMDNPTPAMLAILKRKKEVTDLNYLFPFSLCSVSLYPESMLVTEFSLRRLICFVLESFLFVFDIAY